MSIQGKGYLSIRILGMILIFLVFLAQLMSDLILIGGLWERIILILIITPWFIVYLGLKFELSFFSAYNRLLFLILIIYSSLMNFMIIIGFFPLFEVDYIFFSNLVKIFLLTSWSFSLTIYKRKKLIFIVSSFISSIFLIISCWFYPFVFILILSIINLFLYMIGFLLILFSEYMLRKKGFLNYI